MLLWFFIFIDFYFFVYWLLITSHSEFRFWVVPEKVIPRKNRFALFSEKFVRFVF